MSAFLRLSALCTGTTGGVAMMLFGVLLFAGEPHARQMAGGRLRGRAAAAGAQHSRLCAMPPFIRRTGPYAFLQAPRPGLQMLRVVFSTLEGSLFFWALTELPLAEVMTYYMAGPIYVTALSPFLLGERVGWRRWTAVAVGFGGVVLALHPSPGSLSFGAVCALMGSLSYALFLIATRKLAGTPGTVLMTAQLLAAVHGGDKVGHWSGGDDAAAGGVKSGQWQAAFLIWRGCREMFAVEVYAAVRQFVFIEGNSRREAARVFGLSRDTVSRCAGFRLPPGYTRTKPVTKPKLGALLPVIDAILEADRTAPVKQRHTAKRIFERLRDEHGYAGGDDGGEGLCPDRARKAAGDLRAAGPSAGPCTGRFRRGGGGDRRRPAEDPLLLHGPAALGRLFREGLSGGDDGGLPRRTRVGIRLLRRRAAVDPLRQHYARGGEDLRRWQTGANPRLHRAAEPLPVPGSLRPSRQGQRQGQGRGAGEVCPVELHDADPAVRRASTRSTPCWRSAAGAGRASAPDATAETIGERLRADLAAFRDLPAVPLEACEKRAARVSSTALVRYRCNDYSVPTATASGTCW